MLLFAALQFKKARTGEKLGGGEGSRRGWLLGKKNLGVQRGEQRIERR
jgi:hypothetical protein